MENSFSIPWKRAHRSQHRSSRAVESMSIPSISTKTPDTFIETECARGFTVVPTFQLDAAAGPIVKTEQTASQGSQASDIIVGSLPLSWIARESGAFWCASVAPRANSPLAQFAVLGIAWSHRNVLCIRTSSKDVRTSTMRKASD